MISDQPFMIEGDFEKSFLAALPISPTLIFFAFSKEGTWETLKRKDDEALLRIANVSTVSAAERYVYSTSASQRSFVNKFLEKRIGEIAKDSIPR